METGAIAEATGPRSTPPDTCCDVAARPAVDRTVGAGWWRRAAPIGTGATLAGVGVYVATHDPSAAGSRFPACPFHLTTGLWCPGCGLTRATHALLRGDVGTALATNVFTPLVLVLIGAAWWGWTRRSWDRPPAQRTAERVPGWATNLAVIAVVAYGIARNLPWAPFRSLAP